MSQHPGKPKRQREERSANTESGQAATQWQELEDCKRLAHLERHQRGGLPMRLPPFGKNIRPHTNGIWVCVGSNAWKDAKIMLENYPDRAPLVLPDGDHPGSFRWPVARDDVLVIVSSEQKPEHIRSLGEALVLAGAVRVIVMGETANIPFRSTHFIPESEAA